MNLKKFEFDRISNDDLEKIREYGKLLFTTEDLAIAMGIPKEDLILSLRNSDDPIFQAYHAGRIETVAKHRNAVIAMSNAGSSPAQSMVDRLITEADISRQ